jgi:hypothetical protein
VKIFIVRKVMGIADKWCEWLKMVGFESKS